MDPIEAFRSETRYQIHEQGSDEKLKELGMRFVRDSAEYKYTYHFSWLGRPIIQFPQDLVAIQEIVWQLRPDLIVETGIAHGGSLVFSASLLELIGGNGRVLGIDVDIRAHNRAAIEAHPLSKRISMIEGSSVDPAVVAQVQQQALGKTVLVMLDSNHTHEHVLSELQAYSSLVRAGSYVMVFDTGIEDFAIGYFPGRTWGKGNSPKSAVDAFLRSNDRFVVDREIDDKLIISAARGGYLKCVKD